MKRIMTRSLIVWIVTFAFLGGPFTIAPGTPFDYAAGDFIYIPGIREAIEKKTAEIPAKVISGGRVTELTLRLTDLTDNERQILLDGCLMNYYAAGHAE